MWKDRLIAVFSHRLVRIALRCLLGGVFVYASIDKIMHPADFARIIHGYKMVPAALIPFMAVYMPMMELIAGLMLIFGVMERGAAFLLSGLLLVFILALGAVAFRGVNVNCGCFSTDLGHNSNVYSLIVRDIGLMAVGLVLLLIPQRLALPARKSV